ncbi:MAG: Gfo/Idh/MocA family oxidoreductase [Anaerolineae bacterium]|nr:Gfo/Idh/MocA family oxidoreductase [Anaerolineae bacterium]
MIGVGIVGTGGIAHAHARAYARLADQDVRIVAVCDVIEDRARQFAAEVGATAYTDYRRLLERDDVRVVSVCTPSSTHFAISADALRAGKAVLCEKPLVGSLRQLDQLAQLEAEYGGPLNCVFQYRYGRMFRGLRHLISSGLTGDLIMADIAVLWHRDDAYYSVPWRGKWATELGGALTTLAIHGIDALLALAGPVDHLSAETATLCHQIEVEDVASIALRFSSGALGSIYATSCNHENLSQCRFIFQHCTATSHQRPYDPYGLPWSFQSESPERKAEIEAALNSLRLEEQVEDHEGQIADFVASVREGRRPPVSVEAIRPTHEVLTAIYKSAMTGERVALPIAPEDPYYDGPPPLRASLKAG